MLLEAGEVVLKEICSHERNILQVFNLVLSSSPIYLRAILVNIHCPRSGENGIMCVCTLLERVKEYKSGSL